VSYEIEVVQQSVGDDNGTSLERNHRTVSNAICGHDMLFVDMQRKQPDFYDYLLDKAGHDWARMLIAYSRYQTEYYRMKYDFSETLYLIQEANNSFYERYSKYLKIKFEDRYTAIDEFRKIEGFAQLEAEIDEYTIKGVQVPKYSNFLFYKKLLPRMLGALDGMQHAQKNQKLK